MLLMESWYSSLNFSACALSPIDAHVPCTLHFSDSGSAVSVGSQTVRT